MKHKPLFILFVTLTTIATALVGLKLFQYFFPPKVEKLKVKQPDFAFGVLPQPKIESFQFPGTINYTLSIPQSSIENLPKIVQVYHLKTQEINEEKAIEIGQTFDFFDPPQKIFTATPSALLYYQWSAKNRSLKVSPLGQITFKYFASLDSTFKNPTALPSDKEAIVIIKEKLVRLGVKESENLVFQPKISYNRITPSVFVDTQDREQTEVIKIELELLANNQPIVTNSPKIAPIMGRVGNEGKLLNLIFSLFEINWEESGTYPLKTIEQILNDLQTDQGRIVSLGNVDLSPGAPIAANITNINLSELSLAYYQEKNSRYLQPIFILSGTATTDEGQTIKTILYLPAVLSSTPEP